MKSFHRGSRILTATALLALPAFAGAQGFGLNEIGTCAIARGFATVGSPCADGSAIFWSPAAATWLNGWTASIGAANIALKGQFQQDTTFRSYDLSSPAVTVPQVFVNYHPANSNLAFGLGIYVPYGLTSEWPDSFPGRFEAKKASLSTIYIQPNIAYKINSKWSVGGGPVFAHSSVELVQSVDLSTQVALTTPTVVRFSQLGVAKRTEFARATLKGSGNGFGAHIGVAGVLSPEWTMGARFLLPISLEYNDADATFAPVTTGLVVGGTLPGAPPIPAGTSFDQLVATAFTSGPLQTQKVSTRIAHPAQVGLGLAYTGWKNAVVDVDYQYTGWKQFREIPITFKGSSAATTAPSDTVVEDYNNTSSIRIGIEYDVQQYKGLKLRAGAAGAASAAPAETVTPLLPEQDRAYWTLGGGYTFMTHYALDAAFAHIYTGGTRGRLDPRLNRTLTAVQMNTGRYELSANILSVSLKANF